MCVCIYLSICNLTPCGQDWNRVKSPDFGWLNVNRSDIFRLATDLPTFKNHPPFLKNKFIF